MIRPDRRSHWASAVEVRRAPTPTLAKSPTGSARVATAPGLPDHVSNSATAASDNVESTEQDSMARSGFIINSCKSWMISTCLHVVAIVLLALCSLGIPRSTPVSLVVDSDQSQSLAFVEELVLDTMSWDELNASPEERLPDVPELSEWDSENIDRTQPLSQDLLQAGRVSPASRVTELKSGRPSFFGIEATGNRIVYVVDRSGSMDGDRWFDAREEIVDSIGHLRPDQEFFIFLFSRSCHPMPHLAGAKKMIPATEQNVQKAKDWLFKQIPDGHTYPLSSIKKALQMEADTIFLLTDGNFQDETGRYLIDRAMLRQSTSEVGGVVINTIAFHCEVGLEMLKQIAVANAGTFRNVVPDRQTK